MLKNERLALALLVPAVLAAGADAAIFYSNNFEQNEPYAEWSSSQRYNDDVDIFTQFLGRFTNGGATLTLAAPPGPRDEVPGGGGGNPPQPRRYLLEFDFYCIDSWDGSDPANGEDHFAITVNNAVAFNHTFANQHPWQSYPGDPAVGPVQLGFDGRWNDSIYRLSVPFATDAPSLAISFFAYGLHGSMNDESWGIDNVRVSTVPVPAPAGAGVLALMGLAATRRKR